MLLAKRTVNGILTTTFRRSALQHLTTDGSLLFATRFARLSCRGARKSKDAAPQPRTTLFWNGPQTGFGEGVRSRRPPSENFGRGRRARELPAAGARQS